MKDHQQTDATAHAYARSLLELASEQNQAAEVGDELAAIEQIIEDDSIFSQYLGDPGITASERAGALDRIFRGRVSPLVFNFIGVLNNNGRLRHLSQVQASYAALLDEQLGNVEVDVTSAQKLDPDQLETVRQRISGALGKTAVVHQYVDESIIGGLIIRVQDRLIDASVRYQLQAMKERLVASTPK